MSGLPRKPLTEEEILTRLETYRSADLDAHSGRVWAYVYKARRPAVERTALRAHNLFQSLNALDFTVFPSLLRLETEVVRLTASLFHPDPDTTGSFTSGGTESILLAVKAARDRFRERHGEDVTPEIVAPITAHAAFHKAAHYLGLKMVLVPVDPSTFQVDPMEVRRALSPRTALIVASAVNYSHGVMDPVAELGTLAAEHDIWLHVDACIGGFLLPYLRRLGEPVPPFDFEVPGVLSLSVDLHKYAFAPKGASVVLYRDRNLRRYQYFACTRWSGYPVINATVQSTKSGGPLAASWATLHAIGDEGYLRLAEEILAARKRLEAGIPAAGDFQVVGPPQAGLLAFTSPSVNLFVLADRLRRRGWYVQVQPGRPEFDLAPTIHLTVTPASAEQVEAFLADLAATAREAVGPQDPPFARQLAEQLKASEGEPLETLRSLLGTLGIGQGSLPQDMAEVNALLRHLPPEWTEVLLIEIVNGLFQ